MTDFILTQGTLPEGEDPPPIKEGQWAFLSSCDDSELFGDGPAMWVHNGKAVVILTRLRPNLTGVLVGRKQSWGRTHWREYRRVELPFKEACLQINLWAAAKQGEVEVAA